MNSFRMSKMFILSLILQAGIGIYNIFIDKCIEGLLWLILTYLIFITNMLYERLK